MTGIEFWEDLVDNYGYDQACKTAKSYLDCPMEEGDTEEWWFRHELWTELTDYEALHH